MVNHPHLVTPERQGRTRCELPNTRRFEDSFTTVHHIYLLSVLFFKIKLLNLKVIICWCIRCSRHILPHVPYHNGSEQDGWHCHWVDSELVWRIWHTHDVSWRILNVYEILSTITRQTRNNIDVRDQGEWQMHSFVVNSSLLGAVYMRRWTGSTLVQIMACRLVGAKP